MDERISLSINEIGIGASVNNYRPIVLHTNRGEVSARFYHVPNLKRAVIFAGDKEEGYDSPAHDLYQKLASQLVAEGISCLWIKYRNPLDLVESTVDVMAGIMFLEQNGIEHIGLVGHAFGSAVAIQAAANDANVDTVVSLAAQGHGIEPVKSLGDDTSLLLIHGKNDTTLPYPASEYVFALAHEPKELILLEGNGHRFNESSGEVYNLINDWLLKELKHGVSVV